MRPNMFSEINMPSAKTVVSTAASVAASAMVVRSIAREFLPYDLQRYVLWSMLGLFKSFSSELTMIIEEFDGLAGNQIYKAAAVYLGTKISPSTQRFRVSMPEKETKISTSMAKNQEITDIFDGVQFKWRQVTREVESKHSAFPGQYSIARSEVRYYELRFHKKHKDKVFNSYFPFILEKSKSVKEEKKTLKLHTLNSEHMRRYGADVWHSIKLDHPATFDTLAMEPSLKRTIMEDLERFGRRKDFYRRVGKAWKRGYLLYGPPGTGKSSLIAAIANFLNFDIYDLELTDIHANSDLRKLLLATGNQSILVVEDIDCSLEMQDRQTGARGQTALQGTQTQPVNPIRPIRANQVTLSGLLNFIDGLWSSCGDERIILFTTNHIDRIDPALLRPGRMDVHIHMSYCTPSGFRILAANYLGIADHSCFSEIEELMEKTTVTPAEVGEQLLKNEDPDIALRGLILFLREKKIETERAGEQEQKEDGQDSKNTETEK